MDGAAVVRDLGAIGHAVVSDDARDAQAVVGENAGASSSLGRAVRMQVAPRRDRGLIAPERQRQELAGLAQAFETFDRDEAVDRLQLRAQGGSDIQIFPPALGPRPYLEDDSDHRIAPLA